MDGDGWERRKENKKTTPPTKTKHSTKPTKPTKLQENKITTPEGVGEKKRRRVEESHTGGCGREEER